MKNVLNFNSNFIIRIETFFLILKIESILKGGLKNCYFLSTLMCLFAPPPPPVELVVDYSSLG